MLAEQGLCTGCLNAVTLGCDVTAGCQLGGESRQAWETRGGCICQYVAGKGLSWRDPAHKKMHKGSRWGGWREQDRAKVGGVRRDPSHQRNKVGRGAVEGSQREKNMPMGAELKWSKSGVAGINGTQAKVDVAQPMRQEKEQMDRARPGRVEG